MSEHMWWTECSSADGTRVRYGASVRLIVQFSGQSVEVTSGLPSIAAAAQLGHIQANVFLSVVGFPPGIPGKLLLDWEPITVTNYADVIRKASDLRKYVADNRAQIRPVRLGVINSESNVDDTFAALGRVLAIGAIADGKSCSMALDALPGIADSDVARATVRAVYSDLADDDACSATAPSGIAVARAAAVIGNKRLRGGTIWGG